jgi:sugar lactone lactonase YvrE
MKFGRSEFAAIRKKHGGRRTADPDSPVAFRLDDPKLIPEGIAWDPKGERFFVGSVAQRKIVVADANGETRDFSRPNGHTGRYPGTHDWRRRSVLVCG